MDISQIDFHALSLAELNTVITEAQKAKATLAQRNIKEAAAAAHALAAQYGITIEDLADGISATAHAKRSTRPPKFANPADPTETWTGNGRKPKWVQEFLANGGNMDDVMLPQAKEAAAKAEADAAAKTPRKPKKKADTGNNDTVAA